MAASAASSPAGSGPHTPVRDILALDFDGASGTEMVGDNSAANQGLNNRPRTLQPALFRRDLQLGRREQHGRLPERAQALAAARHLLLPPQLGVDGPRSAAGFGHASTRRSITQPMPSRA